MRAIIDIVLILIIALCTWNGYKKGLVGGIAGILAIIIALFGGSAGLAGAVRYFLVVLAAGVLWPMAFRPLSRLGQRGEG